MVGDIMYDVALRFGALADRDALTATYRRPWRKLALHRAENFDRPGRARQILDFVASYAQDHDIVFPIHPGTRAKLAQMDMDLPAGLMMIDPLPYIQLQGLLEVADLVLTDSGSLQKEAYFHRKPCTTLRDEIEWVETVDAGWNALWTNPIHKLPREIEDYGQGDTADRIMSIIRKTL